MSQELIGCCGLTCSECPAYLATKANDHAKAEETARIWARDYGVTVAVADVWCDGCTAPGKKCAHCAECELRTCAQKRGLATCAPCADYPCPPLAKLHGMVPPAKANLDRLRAGG
ncbi:MAG TPA: DUF3795 domain-containing protein [Polyangia bacterium]